MELIIRFETYYDGGIYQDHDTGWAVDYDSKKHPLPNQDSGLQQWYQDNDEEERYGYSFGFNSLTQARAWFYNYAWLEKLDVLEAKLVVYAVRQQHIVEGYAQTVFVKREAERIAEFPCVALHNPQFDVTLGNLKAAVHPARVHGSKAQESTRIVNDELTDVEKIEAYVKYCLTDVK